MQLHYFGIIIAEVITYSIGLVGSSSLDNDRVGTFLSPLWRNVAILLSVVRFIKCFSTEK